MSLVKHCTNCSNNLTEENYITDQYTNDIICGFCGLVLGSDVSNKQQDWRSFEHESKCNAQNEKYLLYNKNLKSYIKTLNIKIHEFMFILNTPDYLNIKIQDLVYRIFGERLKLKIKKIDYIIVAGILIEYFFNDLNFINFSKI